MTAILRRKQLGEIIKLEYGKPLPQSGRKFGGRYPVYGANGIISRTDSSYVNHRSIIIGRKGSAGELNLTEDKFWPLDVTYFITFDENKYDLGFLYRLLTSLNLQKLAKGVKPGLNRNDVYSISVRIPELIDEQKKIAQAIDAADLLRQKRNQSIQLLDDCLKSVFLELFGDPVRNAKKWDTIELGKLCNLRRGASPRPINDYIGEDIAWIKIGDATNGDDIYISKTEVKIKKDGERKSVRVTEGDLIFANCGVSLGFARIMKIEGCIHDGWLVFQNIDPRVNKLFLLKLINHCTEHLRRIAPDGTQPNLNTDIMKKFHVILPPIEQQNNFSTIVEMYQNVKQQMLSQSRELEMYFQALMQKAFNRDL